jgi:ADP-heptose:LPS heptosyltransferase
MDQDARGRQPAHRLGEPLPRRVVVLRALKLGDMLCAVPALRALRAALPGSEIVLVGLPWAKAFVERFPQYLDGFRSFPGFPGLPEQEPEVRAWPGFLEALQAERFDLALQLHGSGPFVNPVTMLLGARQAAGFYLPGDYCPDPERFLPYPDHGLEIRRLLQLVQFLGCPSVGEHLEFPVHAADRERLHKLLTGQSLSRGRYLCIHVGASVEERCWPLGSFIEVARTCASSGWQVVLTGTLAEAPKTRVVVDAVGDAALNVAGRTDLGSLAALLDGASLLICNDTGVSHLAAALRVPSVVISTGSNPARWAPIDRERHRVLCSAGGVAPLEVVREAEGLLELNNRDENGGFADNLSPVLEASCGPRAY